MRIASEELRNADMAACKTRKFTQRQLADAYGVHYKTIHNWVKAEKTGMCQIPRKRGCPPGIFNEDEDWKRFVTNSISIVMYLSFTGCLKGLVLPIKKH
jgi:transposase